MTKFTDVTIRWSFYLLFFLVPLVFFSGSFELFEYTKMMLTYAFTIVIAAAWLIKIVTGNQQPATHLKRTILDIPIALYLGAHVLSTIFSIDVHTSIWGYYSRFHEGLLATISYIILYYAAVSNLKKQDILKIFYFSFASGAIISLWGALEHFGNSPSCLFITGQGGVNCWIQDVKNRVFATLGQPNWMAAYLDVLILISLGFVFKSEILNPKSEKKSKFEISKFVSSFEFRASCLAALYFAALLFTKSRSGILGLAAGLGVFASVVILNLIQDPSRMRVDPRWPSGRSRNTRLLRYAKHFGQEFGMTLGILAASFILLIAIFGLPFAQTEKFTLEKMFLSPAASNQQLETKPVDPSIRISESSDIRNIVWEGAVKVWQRYPLFGSGVETFAYSYYKDRPVAHNMVSEWDFLYNKAHNEFLNILATTGLVGMLAYLSIPALFTWWFIKSKKDPLLIALYSAWISILVTNFFGFSVVIIGLFFFLIPAFSLILTTPEITNSTKKPHWITISLISLISLFFLINLVRMWQADKSYAYGKNLDGINQYQTAYPYLVEAVTMAPGEPTFRDELAYNQSVLALAFWKQSSTSAEAKILTEEGIKNSDLVLKTSPNILTFWKTRTRLFYNLAAIDKRYLFEALNAIRKSAELAPTDAKVNYNLGLLLGQTGDITAGIKMLENTVRMKPDYADAHYALGLYYAEIGEKAKAKEQMEYMLKTIGTDARAQKWLKENK